MNDLDAIRRTLALYGQLIDDKRFDDWCQLFTDDGSFTARGMTIRGRADLREKIGAMMAPATTKHTSGQPVIDIASSGMEAYAWTDTVTFAKNGDAFGIVTVARAHDRLERGADGRWRIERREMVLTGDPTPDRLRPSPPH